MIIVLLLSVLSYFRSVGQDTAYHKKILDSALIISNKALAITFLKEKAYLLSNSEQYFRGLYFLRIGRIYGNQHQLKLGKEYYKKGLKIGLLIKNNELIGKGFLGVGGIQLIEQLHNPTTAIYDSVLFHFEQALPYLKAERDVKNIEGLYSNIALVLANTGKIDSARKSFERSLQNRLKLEDKAGIISSLINMGLLNRRSMQFDQAHIFYSQAFKIAKMDTMLNEMAEVKLGISRLHQEAGNYKDALSHFFEYDSLTKLFLNAEFQKQIAISETKFETTEKQIELDRRKRQITQLTIILVSLSLITVISSFLIRQRRKMTTAASEKAINDLLQQQEVKTAYALLEGQDKERKRIASELHDNLGSILTSLNMFSDAIQSKKDPHQIAQIASKISETSHLAYEEVRKISHSLDSGLLKHFGLKTAIKHLMEAVESSKKVAITTELQIEDELNNETGLEIYRMLQELINNTLMHSACSNIRLDISHINNEMTIIFQDNGIGFDPGKVEKGLGLKNLENRAQRLGGTIDIVSKPGKGSSFIIEIFTL